MKRIWGYHMCCIVFVSVVCDTPRFLDAQLHHKPSSVEHIYGGPKHHRPMDINPGHRNEPNFVSEPNHIKDKFEPINRPEDKFGGAELPVEHPVNIHAVSFEHIGIASSEYHQIPEAMTSRAPSILAQELRVLPAPLLQSDHELQFNISWSPPLGGFPTDYSLEVRSTSVTSGCETRLCYEYNIPGNARWWVMPAEASAVDGAGCTLRPGCSYRVRLVAHPWDGRTSASLDVQLDECVMGVCSCGHAVRLPQPSVRAVLLDPKGIRQPPAVNISWTLPPGEKRRLPPHLLNDYYYISVGRQLLAAQGLSPWFAHEVTARAPAGGETVLGDQPRWYVLTLPQGTVIENKTAGRTKKERQLARVALVDSRGCIGPAGNYSIYDPVSVPKQNMESYVAWLSVALVSALGAAVAALIGTRRVKRALVAWRAPAPMPTPLRRLPAWPPIQSHK